MGLVLEPQAQLVWQRTMLDRTRDLFSSIDHRDSSTVSGRIGARLQGRYTWGSVPVRPYLTVDLWHTFKGSDKTLFDANLITTRYDETALEVGGGVAAEIASNVSLFAKASYLANTSSERSRGVSGNIGLQVTW